MSQKKTRKQKPLVGFEEMRNDRLYKDQEGTLYRKLKNQVEYLEGATWRPVKVSFDVYQNSKVREY